MLLAPLTGNHRRAGVGIEMTVQREFADGDVIPGTRYRVLSLVGVGGMGTVYEVEHTELGKRFMVKALQRHLALRADLTQRLRNEWRALGRLEHANIVTVTDAGASENGVLFYVMERLDGETLSSRLRKHGALSFTQALEVAQGLLSALGAAHAIGIVHRDIKPSNVFLPAGGGVKLLDFGIAKIQDAQNDAITGRGYAMGTPRYMSPEQVRGDSVDGRTDLYAVGLVLFEMLTGHSVFSSHEGTDQVLLAQLTLEPPRLETLVDVPAALDDLVARLLDKDPRRRPETARVVLRELVRIRPPSPKLPASGDGSRATLTQAPATEPLLSGPSGTAVLRPPRPEPRAAAEAGRAKTSAPVSLEDAGAAALSGTPSTVPSSTPSTAPPVEAPAIPFTPETRAEALRVDGAQSRTTTAVTDPPTSPEGDGSADDASRTPARALFAPEAATRTALPAQRLADSAGALTPPPIEQAPRTRIAPRRGVGIMLTVGGILAAFGLCAALVAAYRRSAVGPAAVEGISPAEAEALLAGKARQKAGLPRASVAGPSVVRAPKRSPSAASAETPGDVPHGAGAPSAAPTGSPSQSASPAPASGPKPAAAKPAARRDEAEDAPAAAAPKLPTSGL
jgi:serine/threonine-protein kinase